MSTAMRPRELAVLMLAAGGQPPRKRARDQKADRAGLDLHRQLLQRLVELDPDPEQLELALQRLVEEMGPASGPPRAIAGQIRDTILAARKNPTLLEHLIGEALQSTATPSKKES